MLTFARLMLFAMLSVSLGGCAQPQAKERKETQERKQAPNFTLKDADGKSVSLADYKGKVVLLNFWATWCGPCKVEIPWFIEFEQRFKDRGFSVLGVSMDEEGWEVVRPYISRSRVNYRILVGSDDLAQQYGGVESLPTTFLIDKSGRIASTHVGLISKSDYENEIVQLLDSRIRAHVHGSPFGRSN